MVRAVKMIASRKIKTKKKKKLHKKRKRTS